MFQQEPDIQNGFAFHMRELPLVLCALKFVGKLIDGSGLDQSFEEAVCRLCVITKCQ